jgi:hypothetical protein
MLQYGDYPQSAHSRLTICGNIRAQIRTTRLLYCSAAPASASRCLQSSAVVDQS